MIKKICIIILLSLKLFAHEKHHHLEKEEPFENVKNNTTQLSELKKEQLNKINSHYLKKIKPIFKDKCMDCHGSNHTLPWYAQIPGPKQIIQQDIDEAKEHIDMSFDFPFKGHGTPLEDLQAIDKSIQENTMPPLRYQLLHWNSSLSKDEKSILQEWILESLKTLHTTFQEE